MRRHSSLGKELSITLFMIRDKNVMVEFKDLLLRGKVISVVTFVVNNSVKYTWFGVADKSQIKLLAQRICIYDLFK